METNFKNTDFFIEEIDESVKDLTVHDSSVTHSPANTDFFIENIDNNVIEIASDRGITPSTVSVVPANTDFFIVNIDNNIKKIASDLSITPSSVQKTPANTDFFIENIYFNLILICEELNIEPYEITISPANTDFFIEAIAKNVEKIMEAQTEIHVSGTFIHAVLSADSEISDYELDGNATQTTYSGKNLININATPTTQDYATSSVSGQTITVTSQNTATTSRVILPITYEANRQMTLSFDVKVTQNDADSSLISTVCLRTPNTPDTIMNTPINTTVGQTNHYTATISATASNNNTRQLWLYTKATNTAGVVKVEYSNIQLEYGGSETSYEQYVGGIASPNPDYPQAINTVTGEQVVKVCGKNLFTTDIYNQLDVGGSAELQSDGYYKIRFSSNKTIMEGEFQPNTQYTISAVAYSEASGNAGVLGFNYTDGTSEVKGINQTSAYNYTITSTAGKTIKNIKITYGSQNVTYIKDAQLELGSTATDYEAYDGQEFTIDLGDIELAGVGAIQSDGLPEYRDTIKPIDGKWYIEKQVGKVVLDGSESGWGYNSTRKVFWGFNANLLPDSGFTIQTLGYWAKMSDNFTYYAQSGNDDTLPDGLYENTLTTSQSQCLFHYSTITSLADWKTWLSTHPTTVYYALATPTTTEITDESLLSDLNAIYDAELKEGVLNISITATSPNLPASLKATIIPKE